MDAHAESLGLTTATRVILYVNDFEEAVAFYEDALNLALAYPAGGGWAEFDIPGTCALCLHEGRLSDIATHKIATFGWAVDDLDGAIEALRSKGVEIDDPHPVTEGKRAATFFDPSGNALFFEGA